MDRKQFEEWFKTTLSYAIFEDSNVWKVDLYAFNEPTNSYLHSGVQAAFESYQHQQAKVEELQKQLNEYIFVAETLDEMYVKEVKSSDELQKRVEGLERKLQIKTRHCEFYEQSRKGHRSLAIHRKKQINSALEQIEKLYSRAESDYQKDRNPYYDGMLSALDLAEQAIRGELEEQALKGEGQ